MHKRIGVMIGLILILGVNLSLIKGLYLEGGFNISENLNLISLANQNTSELISDNSTWTDFPIDDDSNGYYDRLVVNLGTPKPTSQELNVYGILNDSKGNLLGISQLHYWDIGNELLLSFPGKPIYINGVNGPYFVLVGTFEYYGWWGAENFQMLFSYVTGNYNASDFELPNAKITEISDYGNDTNNDEVFDDIIFEVTVEVNDPGYYDLEMYLQPSAPFLNSNRDLVGSWEGFLRPGDTSIIISFSIDIIRLYQIQGYLNISYIIFKLYGSEIQLLTDKNTTNFYSFEPTSTNARLTGNYWDWGVDTDLDEKFDLLVVAMEVNVTLAGEYSIFMRLILADNDLGDWYQWTDSTEDWNAGVHNATLQFDANMLYSLRNELTLAVEYVEITQDEVVDFARSPYNTRSYNYSEFDLPRAYITGNFWDRGVDTSLDGKIDQILVDTEINFTSSGTYVIEFFLSPHGIEYGYWDQWMSQTQYWDRGVTNVTTSFDASNFYSLHNSTYFILEYIRISNNYDIIDYSSSPYITRIYNHTDFDFPIARLTGKYWGRGVDNDEDNKFDYLAFDIEINVTEAENYVIRVQIESELGNYEFWGEQYEFLNEGLHWIRFEIDGAEIFRNRVHSAYVLTECQIIRTDYWISVDRSYYSYVSKLFNYMEFNPPSAYLTGNFWDRGVDTDSNGKYDEIIIVAEVNITQRGEYEIELNIRPFIPIWDTNFWGYSPNQRYNRGIHNITVQLYVTLPYSLRLDTAYVIEFITVRETDYWEVVDEMSRPYITRQYKTSEFESPDIILTGSIWENAIDSDSNGKYNFIEIVLELNVTQSGVFYIEYNIRSLFSGYSDWKYIEVEYQKGVHNFSISTGGTPLYSLTYGSSVILEIPHFKIFDSNLHLFDKLPINYITKTYRSKFFEIPTAYFTGSLYDYPVNTDDDGYMEEIQIYVQVNITKAGWFTSNFLIVILKWSNYEDIYDSLEVNKTITQYFERGIQFVVIHLDRELLYSMDHDTTRFEINLMRIFDSDFNLCDYRHPSYSSAEYITYIFSPGGSQSSTSYGTSVSLGDDEPWAPPLNLVFGIVGLSIFLSTLYLLQRTKRQ